jgi:aldehyde dehydrogenase (NAD+)
MKDCCQFYIDGLWVDPAEVRNFTVINPATEEPISTISLGSGADVDRAVAAAKRAFESYSETSRDERLALLRRVLAVYQAKMDQMAETISLEMGAPISLSRKAQAPAGLGHLAEIVKVLEHFKFEELKGSTLMRKEPIGVCGLITPWNWPMNQIVTKVAPALAAGCTMVLIPSVNGSPTLVASADSLAAATTSAILDRGTSMRVGALQDWPALRKHSCTPCGTAFSLQP